VGVTASGTWRQWCPSARSIFPTTIRLFGDKKCLTGSGFRRIAITFSQRRQTKSQVADDAARVPTSKYGGQSWQ
jgi:hypothetical protein